MNGLKAMNRSTHTHQLTPQVITLICITGLITLPVFAADGNKPKSNTPAVSFAGQSSHAWENPPPPPGPYGGGYSGYPYGYGGPSSPEYGASIYGPATFQQSRPAGRGAPCYPPPSYPQTPGYRYPGTPVPGYGSDPLPPPPRSGQAPTYRQPPQPWAPILEQGQGSPNYPSYAPPHHGYPTYGNLPHYGTPYYGQPGYYVQPYYGAPTQGHGGRRQGPDYRTPMVGPNPGSGWQPLLYGAPRPEPGPPGRRPSDPQSDMSPTTTFPVAGVVSTT